MIVGPHGFGFLGPFSASSDPYKDLVLSQNPFAYYRLNDDVGSSIFKDYSGNGRDLDANGAQFQETGALSSGDEAIFVDDQGTEQFNSWSFASLSITVWLHRDPWGETSRREFLQMFEGGFKLNFGIENGSLKVWLGETAGEFLTYSFSFTDGTWHHFAFTSERIDSSTVEYKMFVDGSEVDSGQADANDTTGPITFPAKDISAVWVGKVDELAIFDKILSLNEINNQYQTA